MPAGMPSSITQQPQSFDVSPRPPGMPGLNLLSMEEFDAEMQAHRATEGRSKENEVAVHLPKSKKQKSHSPPTTAQPVLLPAKPKAEWVPKLNHLAQLQGLAIAFDFVETAPATFSSTMVLLVGEKVINQFSTADKFFRSKKEAKETVAEAAVNFLSTRDNPPRKKTASSPSPGKDEVDRSENWMGILNHFCQTSGTPTPVFQEYQKGNIAHFSASFSLPLPEGRQIVFGDSTKFCSSKKIARTIAAQEAVLFLRGEGLLPSTSVSAVPQGAPTALSTSLVRHTPPSTTTSSLVDNRTTPYPLPQADPSPQEITAQILALCKTLGLPQPIYQHKPSFPDTTPHWVDSAAFFPGSTDLQGPIGAVERIFGKKNAKEECAKRVLVVLEELKAKRTAGIRALKDGLH